MRFDVTIKKKVLKNFPALPENVRERFYVLVKRLESMGATSGNIFQNYSKLGENEYHCHLTYHYVACWWHEKKTITIEVDYVGSREDAPY